LQRFRATFCGIKELTFDCVEMKGVDDRFNKETKLPGKEWVISFT
jgi:hypothetical protein